MRTLVFQSYKQNLPSWLKKCQQSVQSWSVHSGYDYAFIGDEIFHFNPPWFDRKVYKRLPIRSDLARLLYTQAALQQYDQVVWMDIDCFIFAPDHLTLQNVLYMFGHERWIQPHPKKGWKIYKNVCNAFFQFQRTNTFLPFYIETAKNMIRRVDKNHIAPQMIGPKLLTALHNIVDLPTTTMVGSASPWLIQECAQGGGPLLARIEESIQQIPCSALNLCYSLFEDEDTLISAMTYLQEYGPIGGQKHKR